jgi:hypothetical protein
MNHLKRKRAEKKLHNITEMPKVLTHCRFDDKPDSVDEQEVKGKTRRLHSYKPFVILFEERITKGSD